MPVNLDHLHLHEMAAEIGYRLSIELDRRFSPTPRHLQDMVRALDDLPETASPPIVPTRPDLDRR